MICIKHVRYNKKGDSDVPFFVPLWLVTVVTNVFIVINVLIVINVTIVIIVPFVINVPIVIVVPIVPNVIVVPIVTNVLAVLAAPNAYTKFFFFGFSVTIGTSISSIEMPPCWKVSL